MAVAPLQRRENLNGIINDPDIYAHCAHGMPGSLLTRIWLTPLRGLNIRNYLMQGPYVAKLMMQYVVVFSQTSLKNGENIRQPQFQKR